MARKPFVVIDAEILSSSVWSEEAHVKLVWLTMLILCDTDGYVGASIPGIARAAGVTLEQAREAIAKFKEPDPDSRTKTDDGRRVEDAERGFRILNFKEHLDRLSAEKAKTRDRVRKFRERKRRETGVTESPVTVHVGRREKGEGNRDNPSSSILVGREVVVPPRTDLPPRLPADVAESAVTDEIRRLQNTLGSKLAALSEHPNNRDGAGMALMVPAWSRKATSYTRKDGTKVPGVADYRTVTSIERLEKSIADADRWLRRLDEGPLVEVK